jgi:phospholipase/carboxylesterase
MHRRRFLQLGSVAVAGLPLACLDGSMTEPATPTGGRLTVRWKEPTRSLDFGESLLGFGDIRDGFVRIPDGYDHEHAAPLALLLHGAGGDAREWVGGFPLFDELGMIVLAVDSRAASWDLRFGGFGPDVEFINRALDWTFDRCNVDPARLGISGFSDGASYALSLGLSNGDLFSHVLGFSPGFLQTDGRRGTPPIFLSHGVGDGVLPVGFTRQLAQTLHDDGHAVHYEEFQGGHSLPRAVGQVGFAWFVGLGG